jgi:CBS domain containing-hemolysin-like protein
LKISKRDRKRRKTYLWVIMVSFWTFFLAIIFTWVTRSLIENVQSIIISFILLIIIIFIGIFFDMIGTAVTAADEKPFHAKAAKKIYGAKRGIYLVRNAEQVANFFNDVIGDISGVVSGVVAAVIIINLAAGVPELSEIWLSVLLAGLVSALTVGGKAVGKYFAINHPTDIVFVSARFLTALDRLFFWRKKHKR